MHIARLLLTLAFLSVQLIGCSTAVAPDSPTLTVVWPRAFMEEECTIDLVAINGKFANRSFSDENGRSEYKARAGDNKITARLRRLDHGSTQIKVTQVEIQVFMAPNRHYELHVRGSIGEGNAYIIEAGSSNIVAAASAKWLALIEPTKIHEPLQ